MNLIKGSIILLSSLILTGIEATVIDTPAATADTGGTTQNYNDKQSIDPVANQAVGTNYYPSTHPHIDVGFGEQLAKQGYVFRITGMNQADAGLWNKPAGTGRYKVTNKKMIDKIERDKIDFKIDRVWRYKNGMQYKVISKSKKYSGWIDDQSVYNKYSLHKGLQPIIHQELKIIHSINAKYPYTLRYKASDRNTYQRALQKAKLDTKQLHGKLKVVAVDSIGQVNSYLDKHSYRLIPTILWPQV